MSDLFFRTPGFASGCPRGRLQAAFGISSPTQATGASASAQSAGITASGTRRHFFIESPEAQSSETRISGVLPRDYYIARRTAIASRYRARSYRPLLFTVAAAEPV